MFTASFAPAPSTTIETVPPKACSASAGAMPEPSRAFACGQWAKVMPVCASIKTSAGSQPKRWANQTSSPSQSTRCTRTVPRRVSTQCPPRAHRRQHQLHRQPQQRGFPAAGQAEDRHEFILRDDQIHALKRGERSGIAGEGLPHAAKSNRVLHGGHGRLFRSRNGRSTTTSASREAASRPCDAVTCAYVAANQCHGKSKWWQYGRQPDGRQPDGRRQSRQGRTGRSSH